MNRLPRLLPTIAAVLLACLAAGCRPAADTATAPEPGNLRPVQAVETLARHLRANDARAFARDALPPALHARVAAAWRDGRSRWPLDQLPFEAQLPAMLAAFAAADAETRLRAAYDAQFAGARAEIRAAARTLGLFGIQYVRREGDFSDAEREHYAQLLAALGQWAEAAPLADPAPAHAAIPRLAAAARAAGAVSEADLARRGMDDSLQALSGFLAAAKDALAGYGLSLDDSLDGLRATLVEQTGDRARVRLRYALAGHPVDAIVPMERREGRWYLADHLRQAEAAAAPRTVAAPPQTPAAP